MAVGGPVGEGRGNQHEMLRRRMRHDGHQQPRRPKGPRLGVLRRIVRRIVRLIRGGGD